MSWWGGGEIRPTPGVEWRVRAMDLDTLWPGSSPPSPGLAPWAILICSSSESARYADVTPKRPDATCLMAERIVSPLAMTSDRSGSSPPSPVLDLPPSRFMAMASVECDSMEIDPYDMAPVQKRRTISVHGSTWSMSIGSASSNPKSSSPRSVQSRVRSYSMRLYASYDLSFLVRTASWMLAIAPGSLTCGSPPSRQWYSPDSGSALISCA